MTKEAQSVPCVWKEMKPNQRSELTYTATVHGRSTFTCFLFVIFFLVQSVLLSCVDTAGTVKFLEDNRNCWNSLQTRLVFARTWTSQIRARYTTSSSKVEAAWCSAAAALGQIIQTRCLWCKVKPGVTSWNLKEMPREKGTRSNGSKVSTDRTFWWVWQFVSMNCDLLGKFYSAPNSESRDSTWYSTVDHAFRQANRLAREKDEKFKERRHSDDLWSVVIHVTLCRLPKTHRDDWGKDWGKGCSGSKAASICQSSRHLTARVYFGRQGFSLSRCAEWKDCSNCPETGDAGRCSLAAGLA